MNATRQKVVDQAFVKFDRNGSGSIDMNDIRVVYNTKLHPRVLEGKMTEEEVLVEFLHNFGDVNNDGKITKKARLLLFELLGME